ncbi:MAG: hypothetical protein KDA84_20735 [Planctomycetaceae bacterium]|nr:hypothetical protein [Planctomycetaceae bacterium]
MRKLLLGIPIVMMGLAFHLWLEYESSDAKAAHHLSLEPEKIPPMHPMVADLPLPTPKCQLILDLPRKMRLGRTSVRITVQNVGNTPVTLLHPGDGSVRRMRTQTISRTFIPLETDEGDENHADPCYLIGGTCGICNALQGDELFTLQPGESQELRSIYTGFPRNIHPGKFRVVFSYKNDPKFSWAKHSLGHHNWYTMQRVRKSTPVDLISNGQIIELIK